MDPVDAADEPGDDPLVAASRDERLLGHLPALRGFVRLKCGAWLRELESCSDIVQSVCREMLRHPERLRASEEEGFRAWLFKTAERKVLDRARYHRRGRRDAARRHGIDDVDADAIAAYSSILTPSRVAEAKEEVRRLEAAFERLPESQRDAVLWSRLAGSSYAEIAEALGTSEAYARVLVSRGLARLATLMSEGAPGTRSGPGDQGPTVHPSG